MFCEPVKHLVIVRNSAAMIGEEVEKCPFILRVVFSPFLILWYGARIYFFPCIVVGLQRTGRCCLGCLQRVFCGLDWTFADKVSLQNTQGKLAWGWVLLRFTYDSGALFCCLVPGVAWNRVRLFNRASFFTLTSSTSTAVNSRNNFFSRRYFGLSPVHSCFFPFIFLAWR